MTPERWAEVKERLAAALELEATQRPAYLAEIGLQDPDLRRELESLLASQEEAGTDFLNTSALGTPQFDLAEQDLIGHRLGPYQIVAQLGAGGMGEVYRAFRADDAYRKEVAIKLVAGVNIGAVVSRFKNERQILASLDHPNIARLLDGGATEKGVPYFVMELIEGEPIDEYCDAQRLSTAQRLKLFSPVCSAVQYAHQRLIIHRDIKPGNILVTAEGVPKLLDFGIAKILHEGAPGEGLEATQTVLRFMTPGYASPEQIKGEPITTASDVYSLGVVLYELLTGRSPYRLATSAPHEVARAVCESEPERPSTAVRREGGEAGLGKTRGAGSDTREGSPEKLSKRLAGDLDNIVLMALRKEPRRRYASVEQFAEDLRRHLENRPVLARQDTAAYRVSKFMARHRAGVTATAAIAATLIVGLAVTLREARIAREQAEIARAERTRADRRFKEVRELANSLMFEVHDGIKDLPGATAVRELLVNRAQRYLDSLSQEAGGDASLLRELAAAYDRVGDIQGNSTVANRGDSAGAVRSYRKALAIRESLAAAEPKNVKLQGELASNYVRLGLALEQDGDFPGSLSALRKGLTVAQRIGEGASDPRLQDGLAGAYSFLAGVLNETGDFTGALANYRQAATIRKATVSGDERQAKLIRSHLGADMSGIATALLQLGNVKEAVQAQGETLQYAEEACKANPANATLREYLAEAHNFMGTLKEEQGDLVGALESHRRGHAIFKELLSADPTNYLAKTNFAYSDESIGEVLVRRGDTTAGSRAIREGLEAFEGMVAAGAKNRYVEMGIAHCYFGMGLTQAAEAAGPRLAPGERRERWQEARSWFEKSLNVWTMMQGRGALDSLERPMLERATREISRCDAALEGRRGK